MLVRGGGVVGKLGVLVSKMSVLVSMGKCR